jgi:hypothetical protein
MDRPVEREMARQNENEWHLDKKVPLGLLLTIVIQTVTLVYVGTTWKSDVDSRITALEKTETQTSANPTRITILEQKFEFISETLKRIERKLDKEIPQ